MKNQNGWFKDYGDDQETDDLVRWEKGKPTSIVISGWNGCRFLMDGRETIFTSESIKECKEFYKDCYTI